MSDIATRPKDRNASVVASTSPPARAERRSKRSVPSQAVASTTPIEAATGTSRAAPAPGPSPLIAPAISQ